MITEDYVSFETAKLLREKGFDEPCNMGYDEKEQLIPLANWRNTALDKFEGVSTKVTTPTLQRAMKWLREIHGIDISIAIRFWSEDEGVFVKSWKYTVYHTDEIEDFGQSDTYEQACEVAIKYCLENLI